MTYEGSGGAANTSYYRLIELNRDGYKEEKLASVDDDYYEVGGKAVSYEEFCDYVESIESVGLSKCIEFTEEMFDEQLLGSLSKTIRKGATTGYAAISFQKRQLRNGSNRYPLNVKNHISIRRL